MSGGGRHAVAGFVRIAGYIETIVFVDYPTGKAAAKGVALQPPMSVDEMDAVGEPAVCRLSSREKSAGGYFQGGRRVHRRLPYCHPIRCFFSASDWT